MHSAAPALRLYRGDGRAALAVLALLALIGAAHLFDRWRRSDMARIWSAITIAAACTAALALSACTATGRAIVSKLPDYEIRHAPAIPCSEMLVRVDPEAKLTNAQQRAVLKVCEEMTQGVVVSPAELQNAMRLTVPSPF